MNKNISKGIARVVTAGLFVLAGALHFTKPNSYLQIMPPYLPFPLPLVYLSGAFEILGGLGLLIPRFRRMAGYGLIVLLIVVFPANIQMLVQNLAKEGLTIFSFALILRLPLQVALILLVNWLSKDR